MRPGSLRTLIEEKKFADVEEAEVTRRALEAHDIKVNGDEVESLGEDDILTAST